MRRRDFVTGIAGSAAAWPLVAHAQQSATPLIGCLQGGTSDSNQQVIVAFRKGLSEMGYVEGRNLAIEYRYAQNQMERLPELAADLVRRNVAVIATPGGDALAAAAKAATAIIPIVFEIGGDPVQSGFVASFNRPGGNITGFTSLNGELSEKRLGIMHDLLPRARRFAALVNPNSPATELVARRLQAAASRIGVQIKFFQASTAAEIDSTFASLVQEQSDALLLNGGPPFNNRPVQIVTLAARHALPTIYFARESVASGGLMSYATSQDRFRQVGIYVGRILKGEKPADLPILQPTKFEFIINLQTAKTLAVEVPPTLLAQADEVIE